MLAYALKIVIALALLGGIIVVALIGAAWTLVAWQTFVEWREKRAEREEP